MDNLFKGVIFGIIVVILVIAGIYGFKIIKEEFYKSKEYKNFCLERPNYCYCDWISCEYKATSVQECINNDCSNLELDENTKALCELANKLDDKEMLLKAGCL